MEVLEDEENQCLLHSAPANRMPKSLHSLLKVTKKDAASRDDKEAGGSGERFCQSKHLTSAICVVLLTAVIVLSVLLAARKEMEHCGCAPCPEGWIGFGSKCFYFSDDIENWTFSQQFCMSQKANLVQIETLKEMNFLKRYKGPIDHWIGLSRESPNHSWKWAGNAGYNITFVIRGDGECAYLNDNGVSSGRIYTDRKWICSKPNNQTDKRHIS
ncbi:C-type lectin domain family 2 member D-like [Talpa occidentalis]|uniref:C-type lectin domain family 2 member D-like n=1 Tax=Talpa occidentalis TaxID=50954 RepID=UPI0018903ADD|nr:C-type lectin domain family 2 member D-like [Talpa occidentalis]